MCWRCEHGHEWNATAGSVKRGTWCPTCAANARRSLAALQKLARARRGECLAKTYINAQTAVPWRCAAGHTWSAAPGPIVAGAWCPTCSPSTTKPRSKTRAQLKPRSRTRAQLVAMCGKRGGRVLLDVPDDATVRGQSRATFKCARGHTWTTRVQSVRDGHWCPKCADMDRGRLVALQAFAAERGGRCLAREYIDNSTPMPFECAGGHCWNARPAQAKRRWCPQCVLSARLDLETLQADARARGGRCLASELPDLKKTRIAWVCAKGHRWNATPNTVHKGIWCPMCSGDGTYTLERAREVAAQRGGECLSPSCSRGADPLTWRCSKGHTWVRAAKYVLYFGSWCQRCGRQRAAQTLRARCAATG
jgi:hypothetical protein